MAVLAALSLLAAGALAQPATDYLANAAAGLKVLQAWYVPDGPMANDQLVERGQRGHDARALLEIERCSEISARHREYLRTQFPGQVP